MAQPTRTEPLGILMHRATRVAERAFEQSLEGSGGSRSWWLILRTLSDGAARTQAGLAEAVGLRGATLVHHLDALEAEGLVRRSRDPANRRAQGVAITAAGRSRFLAMLEHVKAYDARLRAALGPGDEEALRRALARIAEALAADEGCSG